MANSIFSVKKSAIPTKKFALTLTQQLINDMNKVNDEMRSIDSTLEFNANQICVAALTSAVKKANKEMEELKKKSSGGKHAAAAPKVNPETGS